MADKARDAHSTEFGNVNIMVVENEDEIRNFLTAELRKRGFRSVLGFEKAEDAVREMKKRIGTDDAFSLAVTDLKLESSEAKYTNPWCLPIELKEVDNKIRLIAITAEYRGVDNKIHGYDHAHFDNWIDKLHDGINPDLIFEMIKRLLAKEDLDGRLFKFARKQHDDDGNRPSFTFNSVTRLLRDAEGRMAERQLIESSKWLLEHFLRHPQVMIKKKVSPIEENVPGLRRPSPFVCNDEDDLNANIRTAIHNIRSATARDFIITVRDQGYIFNYEDWDVVAEPIRVKSE